VFHTLLEHLLTRIARSHEDRFAAGERMRDDRRSAGGECRVVESPDAAAGGGANVNRLIPQFEDCGVRRRRGGSKADGEGQQIVELRAGDRGATELDKCPVVRDSRFVRQAALLRNAV
jgi:hypothetical protein